MEELAREAKDGRIWHEAIKGQGRVIWQKCHRAPEGAKLAIKIWCGQLAPTWSQVGIATTPIEEVPWDSPTRAGTPSVPSDLSSSTEFSSSYSPSSPGPLRLVLESPGNTPPTLENELDLLGPLPSFLDGSSPSMQGPLSRWALS
ncbi:hypothetical protein O181_027386 [Austropuccinia psidii MF-1]|uniref:Uncharacterized protein n=1 Tax=Austropuccinia psidii MF-1 TaxID=1389203 RepID=A0A9Q3CSE5_9BASI|nr:hypothetical protein [Austropuccinia psidii MF-1]